MARLLLVAALIAVIIEAPDIYNTISYISGLKHTAGAQGVYGYIRPFEDLFVQSARPLSYFLPASSHPLFGSFADQLIGSSLYGTSYTEHTLYLGWVPMLLAFAALRSRLKGRKAGPQPGISAAAKDENYFFWFFVLLTLGAWLFSQPPWWNIFGFKLYMPSFFMYKFAPMFRAYCRFGIVVMLGVAVLAGYGIRLLLDKFKSRWIRILLTAAFCSLVIFEFWNWPPAKIIDVSRVPDVYYWLKGQPGDFTIAEYPLYTEGSNEIYRFCQITHAKKTINGATPGTYANKVEKMLTKISLPQTAQYLKWMGVKYVLVHRYKYLQTGLIEDREELDKIAQNNRLKQIKSFPAQDCPTEIICMEKTGEIDIYEITPGTIAVKPEPEEE